MAEPLLAEADDLRDRLGLTQFTDAQTAQANAFLTDASSLIRNEAQQLITRVEDDEATIAAPNGGALYLPQLPADEPTVVQVNGQTVADWTFDGIRTLTRGRGWRAWDSTGALQRVHVTYSHGFAQIPDEIIRICCAAAARAFINPSGVVRSEPRGDFPMTYDTTTPGVYLSDSEIKSLRRALGLPLVASVSLST